LLHDDFFKRGCGLIHTPFLNLKKINMATVYDYIAENNPSEAKSLCEAFGYTITNPTQMSRNLKVLVNNEGEDALKSIMELHPDKDIILEYFGVKKKSKKSDCGCKSNVSSFAPLEAYLHANGKQESDAKTLATNTNTIIFASALVLAVAIIFKNDK
tara:strand:- start:467 stop:937 length:471 start_codon:yes stop_codon:yes gene_type:complete